MKPTVGILAYGSLLANPGEEIKSVTLETKEGVTTPFRVEFARTSEGRRGAPTLVPVPKNGASVSARIFVLDVSEADAIDRLYRREINKVGSNKHYQEAKKPGQNTVLVKRLENFEGIDVVLYTDIAANIPDLTAETLAKLAIKSVKGEHDGRDGISYLIDTKKYGIRTPSSEAYEEEIKRQMEASDLPEALHKAQRCGGR